MFFCCVAIWISAKAKKLVGPQLCRLDVQTERYVRQRYDENDRSRDETTTTPTTTTSLNTTINSIFLTIYDNISMLSLLYILCFVCLILCLLNHSEENDVLGDSTSRIFVSAFQQHQHRNKINDRRVCNPTFSTQRLTMTRQHATSFKPLYSSRKKNSKTTTADKNIQSTILEEPEEKQLSSEVVRPLILLLISQFLLFIGVGAVIPSIPLYGKEIGLSSAANGIVISAPAVALLLAANWGGRQADIARKPAMMIGMAIIAVSDLGTALATTLPVLMLCRFGLGWGRALSEAGERGLLFDLAKQIPSLRGRALAAQQAVVALGITIGAPAGGLVVEKYGPRAAFLCVSVACVIALVLYSFLPETIDSGRDTDPKNNKDDSDEDQNMSGPEIWIDLLKKDQWRGLALCQSGASFGFAAKIASVPILAASILPGGAAGAGALLSAAGVSGLVGSAIGGWTTDQLGAKNAALISGILSGLGLILVPVVLKTPPIDIGSVAIGNIALESNAFFFSLAVMGWSFGATAQSPALTSLAQQYSPPGIEATALSLVKAAGDGTYIIVPFLLGLLADRFTNIQGVECALAGSAICLGTLALAVLVDDPGNNKTI